LQIHQGLLYVWPDASEGAAAAAAAAPLPIIPELDQTAEWEPRTDWFFRDVPISMETVVENVSTADVCVLRATCAGPGLCDSWQAQLSKGMAAGTWLFFLYVCFSLCLEDGRAHGMNIGSAHCMNLGLHKVHEGCAHQHGDSCGEREKLCCLCPVGKWCLGEVFNTTSAGSVITWRLWKVEAACPAVVAWMVACTWHGICVCQGPQLNTSLIPPQTPQLTLHLFTTTSPALLHT
jgi:hypothetical protein